MRHYVFQVVKCSSFRFHSLLVFLAAAIVLGLPASIATAQDKPATAKQPLGKEAYKLLTSFYDYDRNIPLEARVVEKEDLPKCTREKIVFRVRDSWVVGYLAIPKTGAGPYPCVFELHGIGGSKTDFWVGQDWESGENMTKALLAKGIAVFTPDAQHHGERISDFGFKTPAVMVYEQRWFSVRDLLVQSVVECRRAVDYFETRKELDASRIGVIGYSLGGLETFSLMALDKRFKLGVACVTPAGNLEKTGNDDAFAPRNFAEALDGRPFLMLMGRDDPFCNEAQAQRLFDMIPGSQKEIVFYDSGHMLSTDHESMAAKWLLDGLK